MANKKYALAAWTENGRIRMVPSLVNELSAPYREKIERLDGEWDVDRTEDEEVGWILARSRAHEEFARFLLRVGYPREAFVEYGNAAQVCLLCSDRLWLQGPRGDFPVLPLYHRFHAMHRKVWLLTRESPVLKSRYECGELKGLYLWMTLDERDWNEEFDAAIECRKAWRFGRSR